MERLPVEIADIIFKEIFHENPHKLYRLRLVSKTWKNIVDRCTTRLLKVWCKKCSDEIPESCLDDFVQTRRFKSWQRYCSIKIPMPHIARDIYKSRSEFPNLTHTRVCLTEICSTPTIEHKSIINYAVNDKYFAITLIIRQGTERKHALRIYSINNLTHCIREYPTSCGKMDFYAADNQVFLVLQKCNENWKKSIFLAEFLVDENLIPTNLPVDEINYVITKNHCFTFKERENWFQHQRLTTEGFESSSVVQMHFPDDSKDTKITKIQVYNSNLLVFVFLRNKFLQFTIVVYKYQITRPPNDNKLIFSDLKILKKKSSAEGLLINFGADNIPLRNSICDLLPRKLSEWVSKFFQQTGVYCVTIYAYHVLITCPEKFMVFQGSLRQLMAYVTINADPGSKCTVIDLELPLHPIQFDYIRVINIESKPQFLVVNKDKAFTVNLVP